MAAEHRVRDDNHEEQDGQRDGGEKRQRRKRQMCSSSNSGCGSTGWMHRKETNTTNTSLSDYGSRLTMTFKKLVLRIILQRII